MSRFSSESALRVAVDLRLFFDILNNRQLISPFAVPRAAVHISDKTQFISDKNRTTNTLQADQSEIVLLISPVRK